MKIYKFMLLSFCLFMTNVYAMESMWPSILPQFPDHITLGQINLKRRGYLVPKIKNPQDFIVYYSATCKDPKISGISCSLHFYPNALGSLQCLESVIFTISDDPFACKYKQSIENTITLNLDNVSELTPRKIIEILAIAFQQDKISLSHQIPSHLENLVFENSEFEFKKIITLNNDPASFIIYYELINPKSFFDNLINVVYSLHFYKDSSTNSYMCLANSTCILKQQNSNSIFSKGNPFLSHHNKVFITSESFDCMPILGRDLVASILTDLHQYTLNKVALSISSFKEELEVRYK